MEKLLSNHEAQNKSGAIYGTIVVFLLILCKSLSQLALTTGSLAQRQWCSWNTVHHPLGLNPSLGPHPGEEDAIQDGYSGGIGGRQRQVMSQTRGIDAQEAEV